MHRVRTALLTWLCAATTLFPPSPARAVEDAFPGVAAAYLVVRGGEPLWGHAVDARLPPASLTKLMTALLVLERNRPGEVVTVGSAAARETGSRIGLRQGDRLRAGDLLAAAVVRSANDACRALADHVGGSTERFVAMMNRRAQALDLPATRYADPCGHDRAGHVTSAADLARLGAAVAEHPEYLRLAQSWDMRITTVDGRRTFPLDNTNALIGRYPGAIGLKTGYTRRAGRCLVALAERDGVRVLVVLLNAPDRWESAVALMDRAFAERGR